MSKRIIIPLAILAVAALLFVAIKTEWTSWNDDRAAQETDDAYVTADVTPLSTRISGTVRKMEVEDFQRVKAGQVLVDIDQEEYRALVEQAKAALAASQAALIDNQSAKLTQEAKIRTAETMVTQAEAAVDAASSKIAAIEPEVEQKALQRKRQEALMASKATTPQQLQAAVAEAEHLSGLLAGSRADLEGAKAALAGSRARVESEKTELTALHGRDALYRADIEAKRAAITVAEVNLAYTRITAPTNGAVGQRHVQEGQLVTPGMQMVDLVRGDPWVQANYLETQIRNMRKGDAVSIKIDAFPGIVLHGKVEEIAPASGSQFALLPPDNATGNYTKVPQRIPVKIALEPGHRLLQRLRPGMSTEVTVHASGKAVEGTEKPEGPQT